MQKKIKKNIKQRYLFQHFEKKRLVYKIISKNLNLSKDIRWKSQQRWFSFDQNSSLTRIKNICILTGRSKSIYRFFKISRLQLRKLASESLLPGWGQMSFWGATVITNLFSAIPLIGNDIVAWLWGGFSIDNPTLNRFFSLHFTLPFVIVGLVGLHLVLLHDVGSNNPLGMYIKLENVPFYPYFYIKDLFGFILLLLSFSIFVYYYPNILGHPDNYIAANPMKTPLHIVPEWYFLPFYAILRSIPNKIGGVIAMFGSLIILLTIPFTNSSEIRSSTFRPLFKILYWLLVVSFLILGWIGQMPVEYPYTEIGIIAMIYYFSFFLIIIPFIGFFETFLLRFKIR